jgi:signal transduction histidine kinase
MLQRRVTQRTILAILIAGFTVVFALIIVAAVALVRSNRAIQESAGRLVDDQLLMSRLISDIQVGQEALNAVFYKLVRMPDDFDRDELLAELRRSSDDLGRIAAESAGTPEEEQWNRLRELSDAFSVEARSLIERRGGSTASLMRLFELHEQVLQQMARVVSALAGRATATETQIAGQLRKQVNDSLLLLGSCILLGVVCGALTIRLTAASFQKMERQATELSRVSWHMLETQEATARRFSHELHDELGQALAAVKANLALLTPENIAERQTDCMRLVDEAISNVRELSQLLRPVILDDFGLDASLRWLAERFSSRTGIRVRYESTFSGRLADETETHLFRIAQEALTNVARHSGASEVHVTLYRDNGRIRLQIADNGKGIGNASALRGLGLVGMRARAHHAGGEIDFRKSPLGGTLIDVWVAASTAPEQRAESRLQHIHG